MSLNILNVNFRSLDDLFEQVDSAVENREPMIDERNELFFDSEKTFMKFMSQNKQQILKAISRLRPESVYQLAKFVNREYPHVLKDCRDLESFGFIKLVEQEGTKKQLQPELTFDYDIIKVNAGNPEMMEIFNISEHSNRILLEEANAG